MHSQAGDQPVAEQAPAEEEMGPSNMGALISRLGLWCILQQFFTGSPWEEYCWFFRLLQ